MERLHGLKERKGDGFIYGVKESDGYYHYECRYDAGPGDLEYARKRDCNYLKRILQAGKLKDLEPDVYYLCRVCAPKLGDEIDKEFDIGKWWRTKVDIPNIANELKNAKTVYETRSALEKYGMITELSKLVGEYVTPADEKATTSSKPSSCAIM